MDITSIVFGLAALGFGIYGFKTAIWSNPKAPTGHQNSMMLFFTCIGFIVFAAMLLADGVGFIQLFDSYERTP